MAPPLGLSPPGGDRSCIMTPLWVLVNSLQRAPFGTHHLGKWAALGGASRREGLPSLERDMRFARQDVQAWRPEKAEIKGR